MAESNASAPRTNTMNKAGWVVGTTTTLSFTANPLLFKVKGRDGSKATVTDAQAYDVDGRPWPTFFMRQGFGEANAITVMIAGKPKPPLSFALVSSSAGASVTVPILLEKVPVGAK